MCVCIFVYCALAMCVVTMLPAPPSCRAESTERGCRPAADDVVPCADTHSQHQECTPPQCVQTDCGEHEAQSSIHSTAALKIGQTASYININYFKTVDVIHHGNPTCLLIYHLVYLVFITYDDHSKLYFFFFLEYWLLSMASAACKGAEDNFTNNNCTNIYYMQS